MGKAIVTLIGEGMLEEARRWEDKIFQQVCAVGQREASEYLDLLEENLFAQRPAGWVAVGFRERTLVTRFGEVRIQRRLYQDRLGKYHFLLDEYLGLNANQAATPEMQAMCTILCGDVSFRKAADFLEQWLEKIMGYTGYLNHNKVDTIGQLLMKKFDGVKVKLKFDATLDPQSSIRYKPLSGYVDDIEFKKDMCEFSGKYFREHRNLFPTSIHLLFLDGKSHNIYTYFNEDGWTRRYSIIDFYPRYPEKSIKLFLFSKFTETLKVTAK